ncbi:MAG: acyltransferase family protein [Cetobacterium sp.]
MYKDRIEYIDTLKGILIVLVVIGHTGINPSIQKWIYSFHMPLFFIISGFFYKFDSNIVSYKRVKRLLLPFLIYTLMAVIFPGLPLLILKSKELEWEKIFYLKERIFFNTPIWFLIVLFFIEIKLNIISKILSNKQQATSNKQQATSNNTIIVNIDTGNNFKILSNFTFWL